MSDNNPQNPSPGGLGGFLGPNALQQIDTDVQRLIVAVNNIGTILKAAGNPPSVTGSRGGNVALQNLLTVLAAAKIIVNNTTP